MGIEGYVHTPDLRTTTDGGARVLLVALYSGAYPAAGESYGLSAIAGALMADSRTASSEVEIVDMVSRGTEDCSHIVERVRAVQPHVLGISVQYGTFSVLRRWYREIHSALPGYALTVFGGPLSSGLPEQLIAEIDSQSCVVVGEGDVAFPELVANRHQRARYAEVPNLIYKDRGTVVQTTRRLVPIDSIKQPFRTHTIDVAAHGGQVFVETSRGCSWAACTFCLRGLTDVRGVGSEFRRFKGSSVGDELARLASLGISAVTIADEDFLGGTLSNVQGFVDELEQELAGTRGPLFDASMTVHSVFSKRDAESETERRVDVLRRLKELGLRKVFLGIESGSAGQLKRYAKGHDQQDIRNAVLRLRSLGVEIEIGVILFDPLCTLGEIRESIDFLQEIDVVSAASGISSALRLQQGSTFVKLLEKYEARHSVTLFDRAFVNPDTLAHAYQFANEDVAALFSWVQGWNKLSEPLYYPLKSLTRYGSSGALGGATEPTRAAVRAFREDNASALSYACSEIAKGHVRESSKQMEIARNNLAIRFFEVYSEIPTSVVEHDAVQSARRAARRILDDRKKEQVG